MEEPATRWPPTKNPEEPFLNTQFINEDRLQAIVTADLIAKPGLAMVTVVDQELETTSNTVTFTITEPVEPLVITTPRILPPGTLGVGYATLIRATGGVPPYLEFPFWPSRDGQDTPIRGSGARSSSSSHDRCSVRSRLGR